MMSDEHVNTYLLIYTPTHIANLSVIMWAHIDPYWREYDVSMCNYMANVVMI